MKKALPILFVLSIFLAFAQKKDILKNFDKSLMQTSILVQESPLVDLKTYQNKGTAIYGFYQAYKTIQQADILNRLPKLATLKEQTKQSHFTNIIPLSILISDYETIKKQAFIDKKVTNDANGFLIKTDATNVFKKQSLFLATALRKKQKGLQTIFNLSSANLFNTTYNSINLIKIDFNDGLGFRTINLDENITISYKNAGTKTLKYKIELANGTITTTKSTLSVLYSNNDLSNLFNRTASNFTANITPDLSLYGETTSYPAEGEYEIFLSTEANAVLDKPLIIIDGFDPQDGRPIVGYTDSETGDFVKGIYELLDFENANGNTDNLADLVRAEGFDVVILNFPEYTRAADNELIDGGSDFIERNAMLLVELINLVNAQKVGTQPNVIIGPSMGGLVSRYALNYMENQSLNHDTRLWLSFDSPHLGANVPIGFQHQFNFLAFGLDDFWFIGDQNVEALQPLINGFMKSNAARQMLVDSFEAHITDSDGVTFDTSIVLPTPHTFKNIFYSGLNALTASGYPENLRKISMINGSGTALPYNDIDGNPIYPGREVVNVVIDVESGVEAFLEDHYTPNANTQIEVSNVYIDFAWWVPAFDVENIATSKSTTYSHGVDASSGGLFNLGKIADDIGTDGIAGEFLNALQTDYFNFIPSVSAMAIEFTNNEINWFQTPNNNNPFEAWFMPTENEPHITLTQANVDFAWNEIVLQDPALTIDNTFNGIRIANNPIQSELLLLNELTLEKLNIVIFDVTGKQVLKTEIRNPNTQIKVPINLNNGVYFTKISTEKTTKTIKIIVSN